MSLPKQSNLLFLIFCLLITGPIQAQYFPSNLDPVQSIFVVYNGNNAPLVRKYLQIIEAQNKSLPNDQKVNMKIFVHTDDFAQLNKIIPTSIKSNIHIFQQTQKPQNTDEFAGAEFSSDMSGINDDWLQDVGEFYWNKENKPSFVFYKPQEAPPENFSTLLLSVISKSQIQMTPVTGALQEEDSIDGGNIEVTPGGTVYIGSHFNIPFRKKLESLVGADKVVQVPTSHSDVAHVDESYQFLPDKSTDNSCGYALIKTDFIDGLRIAMAFELFNSLDENRDTGEMRPVTSVEFLNSISYFTGTKKEDIKFTNTDFLELLKKFNFSKPLRPFANLFGFRKEDIYVYKVFSAQKKIIEGVHILSQQVKKEGCANLKQVSSPALWTYSAQGNTVPIMETEDVYKTTPVSNLTAFTNFVLLNESIVIPDTKAPSQLFSIIDEDEFKNIGAKLKEIFTERLLKLQFEKKNIHFVDVAGSLLGDGAAHCKTNVLRKKRTK